MITRSDPGRNPIGFREKIRSEYRKKSDRKKGKCPITKVVNIRSEKKQTRNILYMQFYKHMHANTNALITNKIMHMCLGPRFTLILIMLLVCCIFNRLLNYPVTLQHVVYRIHRHKLGRSSGLRYEEQPQAATLGD